MGVAAVTEALGATLRKVPDLRVFDYVPDTVNPPAALIQPPLVLTEADKLGKLWRRSIPVSLVLGRVSERDLRNRYDQYLTGIMQVIPEAQSCEAAVCHAHVSEVRQMRAVQYGGADFMVADVIVEVWAD